MKGTYFIHHSDKTQIYKPECSGMSQINVAVVWLQYLSTKLPLIHIGFFFLSSIVKMAGLSSAEGLFGKLNKKQLPRGIVMLQKFRIHASPKFSQPQGF